MARPKKIDSVKQQPATPVAPAPAMVPMPAMAGMQQHQPMQHHQHQHQMAPQHQHQMPQAIAQQPPMPPMQGGLPPQQRTIGIEEFIRVRDSVYQRFNTLTALMKNFSDDFLRQTNLLIGEPAPFDSGAGPSMQSLVASLDGIGSLGDIFGHHSEEKKERKKRTHDPNAPKRPLTPYFLYMQTARPIIASDLGAEAPKGAVQEEGQRRWASMGPQEKVAWNNAYQFNLRLYNARVHSYKAGNPEARNMTDGEALAYADANGIAQADVVNDEVMPPNDQDAIAEQLQMATPSVADDGSKTPKGKMTRKRKSTAGDVEEGEGSAVKTATPSSPDKRRKRQAKVPEIPEEPKKSARKKK
ncbi:hypothetical protein F5Y17DRAFT_440420 [Xylariaceae sp. FL0594]|nr:hypothetical protein F5Y17DRAFT_440420 [Xylariaceae sp. FL0594]